VGSITVKGKTMIVEGEIGYDQAGKFAKVCGDFIENSAGDGTIDLSVVSELVSPCVAAIHEDCRLFNAHGLIVKIPQSLEEVFSPGHDEGLFIVETVWAKDTATD
jgi:hypothetical protein